MVRHMLLMMTAVVVVAVSSVYAEEAKKECSECPIAAAMKNLPQLTYLVGEETTQCRKTAGKLAEESGTPIVYLVGKKKFEDADKAKLALVTATEEYVATFAEPKTCKISGTTTIAGTKTECSESTAKLAAILASANSSVKQTYQVGEEQCDCPHAAAALAKSTGSPKLFVVGKERTQCAVTARLNLARAQYKAMVEAMAEAQKQPESSESDS